MIIGFPFEERRDVLDTIRFCLKMAWIGVEDIPLFPFIPYPGSAIHDDLVARGLAPAMDNEFFAALGFSNMKAIRSSCEGLGARELTFYRTVGMVLFILVSYTRHPRRFLRTAKNLLRARKESAVEERLDQVLLQPIRRMLGRTRRSAATAT
jgi:hypothetical protein